ncbi:MAG: aminopeptidase [Panacagrimonas sp.]
MPAIKHIALLLSLGLSGCAQLGYFTHLARGQIALLSEREPIATIVGDQTRDPDLRRRLAGVLDARTFAITQLKLPDNGSYTLYTQLDRPYVLWNVLATPEFSLAPVESCFPISGCVAYRGFYDEPRAKKHAQTLREKGYDVELGGVPAYSTLGWFDDPVISSMMHWSDAVLVGTVFHELAHQRLYIQDDSAFNESFARFVEEEGLRQYLGARDAREQDMDEERRREFQFRQLALDTRQRLEALYHEPLAAEAMRARKRSEFERLKAEYAQLRDGQWSGDKSYDRWFARELNNASLLPFGLYDSWVPTFAALFEDAGRDWPTFYSAARKMGQLGPGPRRQRMMELKTRMLPQIDNP